MQFTEAEPELKAELPKSVDFETIKNYSKA